MSGRTQFYLSARMIITDKTGVLMGLETDHWETPGGSIQPTENAIEGLEREAREELGTEIQVRNGLPFFFYIDGDLFGSSFAGSHWQVIYFLCDLKDDLNLEEATDNEFVDLQFMGKHDFTKLSEAKMIVALDRQCVPLIMGELGIW